MGNCAGNPKTLESDAPVPKPVVEEVKVEQQAVETITDVTPEVTSDEKSLGTLLKENEEKKVEVEAKEEKAIDEVKVETEVEEKVETVEEAKPIAIEEKTEAKVEN